jgi:Arc/MetJ-type ribon-helix-helix transcriptional regulator
MTISFSSKELEQFLRDAVRSGRYASEEEVVRDALTRLKASLPGGRAKTARRAKRTTATPLPKTPLTREEFDQYLLSIGLMTRLPDTEADFDDPDVQPIDIQGEPLSETVIRQRR